MQMVMVPHNFNQPLVKVSDNPRLSLTDLGATRPKTCTSKPDFIVSQNACTS